jgi:hypothetical protein
MAHKIETRDVVAAEWTDDQDSTVVRGQIISRTKTSAMVEWVSGRRPEHVYFDDPSLRFLTAADVAVSKRR